MLQPPFDRYDFQTFDVLKKILTANSNCIDIGAHKGEILRKILKNAPNGRHFAFEPIPFLYKRLDAKFGRRVTVSDHALSDKAGTASFTVVKDRPAVSGFKGRTFDDRNYDSQLIEVKVDRLDDVIPDILAIDLIKIDVEGAELMVLSGASEIIRKNKPVVLFEFGLGGSEQYGAAPEMMFDFFNSHGMVLSTLQYFLAGYAPLEKADFCGHYYKGYNYFFIAYDPSGKYLK